MKKDKYRPLIPFYKELVSLYKKIIAIEISKKINAIGNADERKKHLSKMQFVQLQEVLFF